MCYLNNYRNTTPERHSAGITPKAAGKKKRPVSDRTHRLLLFGVSSMLHAAALLSLAAVPCPAKKVRPIEVALLELPPAAEHGRIAPPAWQEEKARPEAGKPAHGSARLEKPETREGAAESTARSTEQSPARPGQPEIATSTAMGGGGESESSAPRSSGQAAEGLPPGDGAANSGGDGQPLRHYLQHIRERIARYKKYPPLARRRQLEGRVGIRFLLSATGEVQRLAISRSSGEELLDQAALKAVQDGSPFPRPPVDLPADPITIELNIVFNLS